MCNYECMNGICGKTGMKCGFRYYSDPWKIPCPDFRVWIQTLSLGSHLVPPAANLPSPPVLNEWERTQFELCPF